MTDDVPVPLPGGWASHVVRAGDTVRRPVRPSTPAVHALLRHLEDAGFDGAPRVLGIDGDGREVLSYVDGETVGGAEPWPEWTRTDETLVSAGRLLRRFHDAVAGFRPPPGAVWMSGGRLGPGKVVCHNDASPHNFVHRDGAVRAFIDWDLAGPRDPRRDLALMAWQTVPLYHPELCARIGWRAAPEVERRLRLLMDAYGPVERAGFADVIRDRIRESRDGILAGAAAGDDVHVRLAAAGVADDMTATLAYVTAHADRILRALTDHPPDETATVHRARPATHRTRPDRPPDET
ncbi:phosphotransferase [Nonomuraea sp. K274]|uniref:Phosphotransferase n=1 Tax=Nonomuraea cypriaca TaxID=1187855 RepID=A0A931EV05_9ACTN|nr:phosphotransferase [Nonomuraea cypriaca]MBF8185134.1 phosphotransferase [Nonomuraea cypriaca]